MSCKESFQTKCKNFFAECNGGQPVTIQQLVKVIREACPNYEGEDSEIAMMFADIDIDGDSLISWEEFDSKLNAKKHSEVTRAELETLFKSKDADGSGKLNKEEVRALCQGNISDDRLDKIISAADADGDGNINFNEFLVAFKAEVKDD